jgi:hypothetical protein
MRLNPNVVCYFDPPYVFDCTIVAIPDANSAPIQVVASLPQSVTRISPIDAIGLYVGIFAGPVGYEQLIGVSGGLAGFELFVHLPVGTRISLRNIAPEPITKGSLFCTFYNS